MVEEKHFIRFFLQAYFDSWMVRWQEDKCRDPQWIKYALPCPTQNLLSKSSTGYQSASTNPKPEFILFMIKYLMMLIVGISSGIWVLSSKTLATWRNFYQRLFGIKAEVYV